MHVAACEKAIDSDVSENKMAKSTSKSKALMKKRSRGQGMSAEKTGREGAEVEYSGVTESRINTGRAG